jgi:hypothetical protein
MLLERALIVAFTLYPLRRTTKWTESIRELQAILYFGKISLRASSTPSPKYSAQTPRIFPQLSLKLYSF